METASRARLGRLGGWCFRHRVVVSVAWMFALAAGAAAGGPVFARLGDAQFPQTFESVHGAAVLGSETANGSTIVALVDRTDPDAASTRRAITEAAHRLAAGEGVQRVVTPYSSDPGELAAAGRDALFLSVLYHEPGDGRDGAVRDRIVAELRTLPGSLSSPGQPPPRVRIGGDPILREQTRLTLRRDVVRAEALSLPLTAVLLVIVFGNLVTAAIPVVVALASAATAMIGLYGFSYAVDLDRNVMTLVTLLGLGLSIDYSLLLVGRFREQTRQGSSPEEAVRRAWARAGPTVGFGASIVVASLAGLLTFSIDSLAQVGVAGVAVSLVAMLAAFTLTPALLGITASRLGDGKAAAAGTPRDSPTGGRLFTSLGAFVQRRPLVVATTTVAFLLVTGAPLAGAVIKIPHREIDPPGLEPVAVARDLADRFHQDRPTVIVVATADPGQIERWVARWGQDTAVATVAAPRPLAPGLTAVEFTLRGGSQDGAAQDLVRSLRDHRPPGGRSWVTGDAALLLDVKHAISKDLPIAAAVILAAIFTLLFLMTGSLVIPLKAILANAISLIATFGVVVSVFQNGVGSRLLGTQTVHGLDPFMVIIVCALSFGLAMDYEVFLLGRIREFHRQGHPTDVAVRLGLQNTGRVITSAAALMITVFACFATARSGRVQQLGLGLATSILVDATIVRCLLVPASMTLFGRWNWWAPRPLMSLHRRLTRTTSPPRPDGLLTRTDRPAPSRR
jgi:putative drug exporter of the RND superfamily